MKLRILLMILIASCVSAQDCLKINCSNFSYNVGISCYWRSKYELEIINKCCPYSLGYEELVTNSCGYTCCCFSNNKNDRDNNKKNCINSNYIKCNILKVKN